MARFKLQHARPGILGNSLIRTSVKKKRVVPRLDRCVNSHSLIPRFYGVLYKHIHTHIVTRYALPN